MQELSAFKGREPVPGNGRPIDLSLTSQATEQPPGRRGFLLDMDGVIYRGDERIPGAAAVIHRLWEAEIPFLFLTNNSVRAARDYMVKLLKMGIEVEEANFYT